MAEEPLNSGIGAPRVAYSSQFEKALTLWKKKDHFLFEKLVKQIEKVTENPAIGKPLRYSLKNRRRLHIDPFVLVYEFYNNELRFIDFDHHDKIYKKYK